MKNFSVKADYIYQSITQSMFFDVDSLAMTHLYLPIIGASSYSIYNVLINESNSFKKKLKLTPSIKRLLKITGLSLPQFQKGINMLEALGLLKTYTEPSININNKKEYKVFYLIYPPKTPKSFFNHFFLTQYLHKSLGSDDFQRTKFFFSDPIPSLKTASEVTKNINDVFNSSDLNLNEKVKNIINPNTIRDREKSSLAFDSIKDINNILKIKKVDFRIEDRNSKKIILSLLLDSEIGDVHNKTIAESICNCIRDEKKITYKNMKDYILGLKENSNNYKNLQQNATSENEIESNSSKQQMVLNKIESCSSSPINMENKNILSIYVSEFSYEVLIKVIDFISKHKSINSNFNWKYFNKVMSTIKQNYWNSSLELVEQHLQKNTSKNLDNNKPLENNDSLFNSKKNNLNSKTIEWEI